MSGPANTSPSHGQPNTALGYTSAGLEQLISWPVQYIPWQAEASLWPVQPMDNQGKLIARSVQGKPRPRHRQPSPWRA
jgi:hypothetical protein